MSELVTCRFCGVHGLEDQSIDPAPRVCPKCFDTRMGIVLKQVAAHGPRGAFDGLKWAGMTDKAAINFLTDLAIELAATR